MKKADNFDAKQWLVENKITTQSRLNEDESNFEIGDEVKYINPTNHKEFKKDISFFTNTPKNPNKPFEVYIEDQAIGKVVDIDTEKGILYILFDEKYFAPNSIRTDKPYPIHYSYLTNL